MTNHAHCRHHKERDREEDEECEEDEKRRRQREREECEEKEERRRHPKTPPVRRPGKQVGNSRGEINGTPMTESDFGPHPEGSWPGNRIDLFLPFLFLRANPGDVGTRPVVGPFWESPDVMILPGVKPSAAPSVPPQLGQTAKAHADNTVYAHIWNLGKSAAREVVVEFYWCNPALGITPGSVNLIGQAFTQLGARGSGNAHTVVKCPESWNAAYVNGGHECLLVRAWDYPSDVLGTPEWDASLNRHIGQRNIHVISAAEAASANVTLHVGPLFGAPATVQVERVAPHMMPWLQLHTGVRGQFPLQAPGTGQPVLSPPQTIGGGAAGGSPGQKHQVNGDDQQISLTTADDPPGSGEAHVYRVSAQQGGKTFGGYTVVVLGT